MLRKRTMLSAWDGGSLQGTSGGHTSMTASRVGLVTRLLVVALTATALALLIAQGTALADDDFVWDTKLTYSLKVDEGSVNLVSDITVTNQKRNTRRGNVITQWYLDRIWIYVPTEAIGVSITSDGKELAFTREEEIEEDGELIGVDLLEIRLPKKLFYNRSVDVRIVYDIPGHDPRSESVFRVNPSYANFSVLAWGDPGRVEVVVILDQSFDVDAWGSSYAISREGSDVIYTIKDIEDPNDWFMVFTARNDDFLVKTRSNLDEFDIDIRSWPGDPIWANEVKDAVEGGLPVMFDLVGLEWEPEETLEIRESIEPNLLGYGGWYLDNADVIEIGEYVDPHLVLHEIGHTWFDDGLFLERWIAEGLADEFASATLGTLEWTADSEYVLNDTKPKRNGTATPQLNNWKVPLGNDDDVQVTEEYGYVASWWVMHELAEEIGIDRLRDVIAAADANEISYQNGGQPEEVRATDDWRRFLDLLQEVGGSTAAPDLFVDLVIANDVNLGERATTRATYASLDQDAGDWLMPVVIRQPMNDWDFAEASDFMTTASGVLLTRNEIEALAGELGVEAPVSLQTAYETAQTDFNAAIALGAAQSEAAAHVLTAKRAVESAPSLLEQVGLIGQDADLELSQAVDAFVGNELEQANAQAQEAIDLIAAAGDVGTSRVIKTGVVLLMLVLLIVGSVILSRRRRRRENVLPHEDSEPSFLEPAATDSPHDRDVRTHNGDQASVPDKDG
jgi:hypothetical protein